ncbi:MAG: DNA polymerase Y family protein [Thiomonas delicata]
MAFWLLVAAPMGAATATSGFWVLAMLRCLLVDFNSYFASVEQQARPELRGRPVGVVPMMADTTCCIAASYEAKAFGVKTGTQVAEARRLCPGMVFVEARHALYVEFHHRAIAAVDRVAPVEQVLSIDEMACGLPMGWSSRERATQLALRIKAALREELGECLRVSVGIAPNVFLAKQASNLQKPDGLVVLDEADLPGPLLGMKLDGLTGIARAMLARLQGHGIGTVEQLWRARREQLRTVWGGVAGEDFFDMLHGRTVQRVAGPRRSLSHSHVLPPEQRNRDDACGVLDRLTQKAAMRLRREGLAAGAMAVGLRFAVRGQRLRWENAARLPHTQDTQTLLHTLGTLWAALPRHSPAPLKVGVVLYDLLPLAQASGNLFDDDTRRSGLWQAVDAINLRYGKHTVYCGSAHRARDAAPMRIAFNHIPDLGTEA